MGPSVSTQNTFRFSLAMIFSQTFLVFDNLDRFEENVQVFRIFYPLDLKMLAVAMTVIRR
jgi:hypothetical protein